MALITTGETGLTCLEACLARPGATRWGCQISCGLRSALDPLFPSRGSTDWEDVEQAIQGTLDGVGEALRRAGENLGGAVGGAAEEIIGGVTRPLNVTLAIVVAGLVVLWAVLREVD